MSGPYFFGLIWLGYRKLWGWAVGIIVLSVVLVVALWLLPSTFTLPIELPINPALGVVGRQAALRTAAQRLQAIPRNWTRPETRPASRSTRRGSGRSAASRSWRPGSARSSHCCYSCPGWPQSPMS